jgi:hypothetical protein
MDKYFKRYVILLIVFISFLPIYTQNVAKIEIRDFKLLPNPFSPLLPNPNDPQARQGQVIQFRLISSADDSPFISVKIYNMDGELVRTLKENEPSVREVQLIWDGKTNDGRYARNGRYIVHLKVKDFWGEKEEIKSSVLIK